MPKQLTVELMNAALLQVSKDHGYCLCIHNMMQLIDFSGLGCTWCLQPVTEQSYGPEAKAIRTEAIKAAYPWAVKDAKTS